ncbi:hypothetical protein D9M71_623840 [compost metagenome]
MQPEPDATELCGDQQQSQQEDMGQQGAEQFHEWQDAQPEVDFLHQEAVVSNYPCDAAEVTCEI